MGKIHSEVQAEHLIQFPKERDVLSHFLDGFDVNWGRSRTAFKTSLSIYILEPEQYIKETFGFNFGIALFIPHYDSIQPRTMQAVARFLEEEPLKGRVDRIIFFLLLKDKNQRFNVVQYANEFAFGWIPIIFTPDDLAQINAEKWGLRNAIARQIFTRDLFDRHLPIRTDLQFFGRDPLLFDLNDAIATGQNRGLFGLRKTGKTSVIFKLERLNKGGQNIVIYLDCKLPEVRNLHWDALLSFMATEVLGRSANAKDAFGDLSGAKRLEKAVSLVKQKSRICFVFDEIEYISFFAPMDQHWHKEYIDFWQSLWSLQSTQGNISFIICGVNALVAETDAVARIQNPLFGIVSAHYLTGLQYAELRQMIRFFGKRMGLNFSEDAMKVLWHRYGGHPLLSRKACSFFQSMFEREGRARPIDISGDFMRNHETDLDYEMEFYCRHVLSELEQFYPDEFEVLCMGASGEDVDFDSFAQQKQFVRHLREYGILEVHKGQRPRFVIECLKTYLMHETARRENRKYSRRIVEGEKRINWLRNRLSSLIKEFRTLNSIVESALSFQLFAGDTLFSPEEFMQMPAATNYDTLLSFLVTANRLINDSIDRSGAKRGLKDFFFGKVKQELPALYSALWRLRCYRHFMAHEVLNPSTKAGFEKYVVADFGTYKNSFDAKECMIIQQIILDELFLSIQESIAKVTN